MNGHIRHGHFQTLVRYRIRRLKHLSERHSSVTHILIALFPITGVFLLGLLFTPQTVAPIRVYGEVVYWGGWPLEMAFYLASIASMIHSFRIMEVLFRNRDAHVLAKLPVQNSARFFYHLLQLAIEGILSALLLSLFFLPLLLEGAIGYWLGAVFILVSGALMTVIAGISAQLSTALTAYGGFPPVAKKGETGKKNTSLHAYALAPAMGLAVSIFSILLLKMATGEIFKTHFQSQIWALPGATKVVIFFLLFGFLSALAISYRQFISHYDRLFSQFFEADLFTLDVGYPVFQEKKMAPRGMEKRLKTATLIAYRLLRLQFTRRIPFHSTLTFLFPLCTAALFWFYGEHLTPWLVLGLGLTWLAALNNPWVRIWHNSLNPTQRALLPITANHWKNARTLLLFREITRLSLPFALSGLLLPSWELRMAAFSVPLIGATLSPLLDLLGQKNRLLPLVIGIFLCGTLTALYVLHVTYFILALGIGVFLFFSTSLHSSLADTHEH